MGRAWWWQAAGKGAGGEEDGGRRGRSGEEDGEEEERVKREAQMEGEIFGLGGAGHDERWSRTPKRARVRIIFSSDAVTSFAHSSPILSMTSGPRNPVYFHRRVSPPLRPPSPASSPSPSQPQMPIRTQRPQNNTVSTKGHGTAQATLSRPIASADRLQNIVGPD
ncbi:hypothetical protein BC628DRAFT_1347491 [Trametes gibbosa]|nr:hypothetical protein BC628DRAFT_1347491 [Trametes gibbosa]